MVLSVSRKEEDTLRRLKGVEVTVRGQVIGKCLLNCSLARSTFIVNDGFVGELQERRHFSTPEGKEVAVHGYVIGTCSFNADTERMEVIVQG